MVEAAPAPHHKVLAQVREAKRTNDIRSVAGNEHYGLTPLYSRVPKDFLENIAYRRRWLEYGCQSREHAQDVWFLCKKDPLWYINTWCFTFDPRKNPSKIPFITYAYQDNALLDIIAEIQASRKERHKRRHDLLIEKSRDMGASWIIILAFEWLWHFHNNVSFLMLSRKEELVDDTENPKALFWKIDFLHQNQPGFLLPPIKRLSMKLVNDLTGSTITGESTNNNAGRADRATAVLHDEDAAVENAASVHAATASATYCRIFNSTPAGSHTEFSKLRKNPDIRKIRMHWSQHPEKAIGAYTATSEAIKIVDGSAAIRGYPYVRDNKLRSPWYDSDCKGRDKREIAKELDIDDESSDSQFFDSAVIDLHTLKYALPPVRLGDLQYDPLTAKVYETTPFKDREDGSLRLWCQLDRWLQPDKNRRYIIAADIATGTGASNSALSIGDATTREKIGEFATPGLKPEQFARFCMALGWWFKGLDESALLIWESNGPGRIFGDYVLGSEYRRIYWREFAGKPKPEHAGWYSTPDTKRSLLGNYRDALTSERFINRSRVSLDESRQYVYRDSEIVHSAAHATDDPSGARSNHADRVIADALLWLAMGGGSGPQQEQSADKQARPGSFAYRRDEARRASEQESYW